MHQQFGYAYDAGGNLTWRTNNNLKMQFKANGMNQLTNVSRTGTMTVSGAMDQPSGGATISVVGTGLPTTTADVYSDGAWASQNAATLADGQNTYTATITDNGQTTYQTVSAYMPANMNLAYDGNGNLTNDGLRSFEYDFENQLTNIYVASGWRSEFRYDGLGRRRARREYTWSGGAWSLTNEVRYVYEGNLVVQERDSSNNPQVTYTRGLDLSGSFQDAGGIGGLLARSDSSGHALYQSDANGNVVLMVKYVSGAYQTVAQYRYDPYGNLLAMNGSLAVANLYRFSSKEIHPNSGLVYYLYRYYAPNLQRWVNRDPIEEDGGINLYQAFFNSPLNVSDAFGEYGNPVCGPDGPVGPSSALSHETIGGMTPPPGIPGGPWKWSADNNNPRGGKWTGQKQPGVKSPPSLTENPKVKAPWKMNPGDGTKPKYYYPNGRPATWGDGHSNWRSGPRPAPIGDFLRGLGIGLLTLPARLPLLLYPSWAVPRGGCNGDDTAQVTAPDTNHKGETTPAPTRREFAARCATVAIARSLNQGEFSHLAEHSSSYNEMLYQ